MTTQMMNTETCCMPSRDGEGTDRDAHGGVQSVKYAFKKVTCMQTSSHGKNIDHDGHTKNTIKTVQFIDIDSTTNSSDWRV